MKTNFTCKNLYLNRLINFTKQKPFLAVFYLLILFSSIRTHAQNSSSGIFRGPVVYVNLMLPSADTMLLVDGTAAMYAYKYSCNVDADDAAKLPNFNENICLIRNGQELAIEARGMPTRTDTLFIHMWSIRQQPYTIQVVPQNIPELLPAQGWLIDKYLHTQTQINLYGKTTYNFSPSSDTNTYKNRFIVVFNRNNLKTADSLTNKSESISVYPNPSTGNTINLKFENVKKGKYLLSLANSTGNIVATSTIQHNSQSNIYTFRPNIIIKPGIYTLLISDTNKEKTIHLLLIIDK